MSFTQLKLKCVYLLSALFLSAALLPGIAESRMSNDSRAMLVPLLGVAIYLAVGITVSLLLRKTVFRMSFSGENCIIKTGSGAYSLPAGNFTAIKRGKTDLVLIRYRDGNRTKRFILRRSLAVSRESAPVIEEMRRRFPNAVFSV